MSVPALSNSIDDPASPHSQPYAIKIVAPTEEERLIESKEKAANLTSESLDKEIWEAVKNIFIGLAILALAIVGIVSLVKGSLIIGLSALALVVIGIAVVAYRTLKFDENN